MMSAETMAGMVKIQLFINQDLIREHEFSGEIKQVTIGRRPGHDIRLESLTVSGDHAVLSFSTQVVVEDLKSTNGTLLNGVPLNRPAVLNPGDMVQIGKFSLLVKDGRSSVACASEPATLLAPVQLMRRTGNEDPMLQTGVYSYERAATQKDPSP